LPLETIRAERIGEAGVWLMIGSADGRGSRGE
jgi:hypothetical protein